MSVTVRSQSATNPADAAAVPGEILVRFAASVSPVDVTDRLAQFGAEPIRKLNLVEGLYQVQLPDGMSVAAARANLAQTAGVVYVEPNYVLHSTLTPNDPSFGSLWALHNTGQLGGTPDADIDAPDAWNLTTGSNSVVVAVIDTGVDYNHPDLSANAFRNEPDCNTNGIDDDGNGYVDDCFGIDTFNHDSNPMDDNRHGTHVAGTIGATGNNAVGVVGVNWNVRIIACKFLDANGSGPTSNAIECLDYVRAMKDRGVNIVATNNSWGGDAFSQALYDAIDVQRQRGILFVAAAGNAASDNDAAANYPSNFDLPNVISVASTTRTDGRSSFSNYGRHTVHLGAPGSEILSTIPNGGYAELSGTSMATPHVTGVAALLKAQDSSRDWRTIRNLILAGGDVNPNLTATVTGRRLDAFGSMTCSSSIVQSRVQPSTNYVAASPGEAMTLRALNINCANPNGNVTVIARPGNQVLTLIDDGVAPDQAAGDGVYSGRFTPVSGSYTLEFPSGDIVTVDVGNAAYDSTLKAPACATAASACDSGMLLHGRDNMQSGAEPHQPNTIGNSCADGVLGQYGADESIDRLKVSSVNGGNLAPGALVRIEATVFAFDGSSDFLDLFYSASATTPSWQYLGTLAPPGPGARTLSTTYILPSGTLQAVRATFRFFGSAAACTSGGFDDHDDLIFSTARGFTDDPIVPGVTVIKAVHITELRDRIDAVRRTRGLAAFPYTNPGPAAGTLISAVHVTELRAALTQAYIASGRPAPGFTDPGLGTGVPVKAVHISEIRAALLAVE